MKSLFKLFMVLFGFFSITLSAQTVHQVAEGTNGIYDAVRAASPGDIIELTTSGGTYLQDSLIVFDFGLTIRAAEGLEEKPIIFSNAVGFFKISANVGLADDYWINFDGVVFDGLQISGADTTINVGHILYVADGAAWHSVKMENCVFQNMKAKDLLNINGNKIMWPPANSYTDSVIFRNNLVQHYSSKGGDLLFFRGSGLVGNVIIENSTIWDAGVFVLDVAQGTNAAIDEVVVPNVLVQNLTISGMHQPWEAAKINTQNAVIKNIISSNRAYGSISGGNWKVFGAGSMISHFISDSTKAFLAADGAVIDSSTFWLDVDPMFEDPLNGNFNLIEGSPAIGTADDGGNLGDPRWDVVVGVNDKNLEMPERFSLNQNYPNPFNPSTSIEFSIVKSGHVTLQIFNVLGQLVSTVVNENMSAGNKSVTWNASNQMSGVYFYQLTSGTNTQVRKMILMK